MAAMAFSTDIHSATMTAPTPTTLSASSSAASSQQQQQQQQQRQRQQKPLQHSASNIEVRSDLLHLAAMELEGMSMSVISSPINNYSHSSRNFASRASSSSSNEHNINRATSSAIATTTATNSPTPTTTTNEETIIELERPFPPGCLHLLYSLPSNSSCHDCHSHPAHWASISYGITLCLQCSGKHRSLGVQYSKVKSLQLDSWTRKEVLCMLEGGNEQLTRFFERHEMGSSSRNQCMTSERGHEKGESLLDSSRSSFPMRTNAPGGGATGASSSSTTTSAIMNDDTSWLLDRYKTKAASFYRQHLMGHAVRLSKGGLYGGREASRGGGGGGIKSGKRRESSRLAD